MRGRATSTISRLSFDAYNKFIEDDFLGGQRLDPLTDGRPDPRPTVRENVPGLGNLLSDFDFSQPPRKPVLLPLDPGPGPGVEAMSRAQRSLSDNEAPLERALDEPRSLLVLRQIRDLKPLEEKPQVILDGVDAEEHLACDLLVARGCRVRAARLVRAAERDQDLPLRLA